MSNNLRVIQIQAQAMRNNRALRVICRTNSFDDLSGKREAFKGGMLHKFFHSFM